MEQAGHRIKSSQQELIERIGRVASEEGAVEPIEGMHINRASAPTRLVHGVVEPALCVIAQGSKSVLLGNSIYRYDPDHYLIAAIELPIAGQVTVASPDRPYLSLRLDLEPTLVGSVMVDSGRSTPRRHVDTQAMAVGALDADLLDAVVRLVRLLDAPSDICVLRPLIMREIVYRLLVGEQGDRLHHLAAVGGYTRRIARAIERLRRDFNQPLQIEHLARELGMSNSGFHHRFKQVTALSPLQFQKQLRLQAARRLLLGEDLDAASAGYRVGYEDASHFSRDYKRLFGESPMRDVERLRGVSIDRAGL